MNAVTGRIACIVVLGLNGACGGDNSASTVKVPGEAESAETRVLEAGADLLQSKAPLRELNAYLDGFHFANGNPRSQMEAHHYCGHLGEEFIQCVIFDGNAADAKLVGVEYIVSKALYAQLPGEEKHFWHSHVFEVQSGQLIAPGIPEVAEHELMEKVAGTYGKTWHTWDTDRASPIPMGGPHLMMGFTQNGQADERMVEDRNRRFDVSEDEKRRNRADIAYPPIDASADAWQKGIVLQVTVTGAPSASRH